MEITSSGPSVELVQKPKKKNIRLCIICQKVQDIQQNKKLTSTPGGRSGIIQTSRVLDDDLLVELTDEDLQNIQYHVRTCYSRYKRSGARQKTTEVPKKRSNPESFIVNELSSPESRHKRQKTHTESDARKKPCTKCDKVKCKDSNEGFRIEDNKRAVNFLNAYNFNKDVFIQDVYCGNPQRTCLQQILCTTNHTWKDTYFSSKETLRLLSTLKKERKILIRSTCKLHSRVSFPLWIWKLVVIFETC